LCVIIATELRARSVALYKTLLIEGQFVLPTSANIWIRCFRFRLAGTIQYFGRSRKFWNILWFCWFFWL